MTLLGYSKKCFQLSDPFESFLEFLVVAINPFTMFSSVKSQVLDTVVCRWFIDVVNGFIWKKRSTYMPGHNETMFENTWRTSILFLHSWNTFTEKLIFLAKTIDDQCEIATSLIVTMRGFLECLPICSNIVFSMSWMRWWWRKLYVKAFSTQTRKYHLFSDTRKNGESVNVTSLSTISTGNRDNCIFVILYELLIPVNNTTGFKFYELGLNQLRVWFSSHLYLHSNYNTRCEWLGIN